MPKIDIVYILGKGSRWNDNELRFSLRSIEKNFADAGKIFVVGECPGWLTGITHIPAPDKYDNKILNAIVKYTVAASDPRIGKDFVLMNDDIFFIRKTQAHDIKFFSRGRLREMCDLHPSKGGYYYHSLRDTEKRLDVMGIPNAIDFEVHSPIIFNKEKLLSVMGMVGTAKAYAMRSCYCNLTNKEPVTVTDFKAANIGEFAMQGIRSGNRFLSINDALVMDEIFREWMLTQFPRKCRYEIDDCGVKLMPGRPMAKRKYHARCEFTYGKNFYHEGDIIKQEDIQAIKNNPMMIANWQCI
jgi:hypothetical protein